MPESPTKRQKRFIALPSFVNPEQLVEVIDTLQAGRDYIIIDVRDDDFRGGNIVGCRNVPSKIFENQLKQIREEIKDIPAVYFHCQLSQVRGPKCAQKYVTDINQTGEHTSNQEVFILRGGYEDFYLHVQGDKKYVTNISYGY